MRVYGIIDTVSKCEVVPSLSCMVVSTFLTRQGTSAAIAFVTAAIIGVAVTAIIYQQYKEGSQMATTQQDDTTADDSDGGPLNRWTDRAIQNPERVYRALFYVAMIFFMFTTLFPFYWLLVLALTPSDLILATDFSFPFLVPGGFNVGAFVTVFEQVPFHLYMLNSFALAITTTVIVLFIASLAGYVFGRLGSPVAGR